MTMILLSAILAALMFGGAAALGVLAGLALLAGKLVGMFVVLFAFFWACDHYGINPFWVVVATVVPLATLVLYAWARDRKQEVVGAGAPAMQEPLASPYRGIDLTAALDGEHSLNADERAALNALRGRIEAGRGDPRANAAVLCRIAKRLGDARMN